VKNFPKKKKRITIFLSGPMSAISSPTWLDFSGYPTFFMSNQKKAKIVQNQKFGKHFF